MASKEGPDLESPPFSATTPAHSAADSCPDQNNIHNKEQAADGSSEIAEYQDASETVDSDSTSVGTGSCWFIKKTFSFLNWKRVFQRADSKDSVHEYEEWQDEDYKTHPPGLPQFAALLDYPDNRIFRRFGLEHCTILLHLQKEIYRLSKRLQALNSACSKDDASGTPYHDKKERTKRIRRTLRKLYLRQRAYDDFLLNYKNIVELYSPTEWRFKNLCNWIFGPNKLDASECEFIKHRYDLVHIKGNKTFSGDSSPVIRFMQNHIDAWPGWFAKLMKTSGMEDPSGDANCYSRRKVAILAAIITVCIAMMILLTPIALLSILVPAPGEAMAIVIVFTLTFITLLSIAVGPKIETLLVGTCTYCAVLVTFLAISRSSGS